MSMTLALAGTQCVWLPSDLLWKPGDSDIPAEAMRLIEDPNWCAQVKEDGNHVLAAKVDTERITTRNREGTPHPVLPSVERELAKLPAQTMFDGEKLHTGPYVVFDILYLNGEDLRDRPYRDRFYILTGMCEILNPRIIYPVRTALTTAEKLALVLELREDRAEGVILKDLRATYRPGRPEFGGSMRRLKFRKSLTCLVRRRDENDPNQKASFDMFAYDGNGKLLSIGAVSARHFHKQVEPGCVRIAECSYLYATPKNKVVQPTLLMFREDKSTEDCSLSQLILGGRFAERLRDSGEK